jgi:CheY-like chemotaxis protein
VYLHPTAEHVGQLHISVHDTGIGIPADKHQTIFESFQQSDSSTTRRFGGTGLGLAITAQLVELMDGHIFVESEVGQGSTFHVVLPLRATTHATIDTLGPPEFCDVRVLLFSRRETSRRVYGEMLRDLGARPTLAASPREVVSALRSSKSDGGPFEAVIVDVDKSDTSSLNLLAEIGIEPHEPGHPAVIALQPAFGLDVECASMPQTLDGCVIKPLTHEQLANSLVTALGRGKSPEKESQHPIQNVPQQSLRVLVADDGPVNQEVIVGLLELAGHSCEVVDDGQKVLAAIDRSRFDVVLMDLEMPVMDGFEATASIRSQERESGSRLPIIAMTAHAVQGYREECLQAGMDGHITKPIKPQELFEALSAASAGCVRASEDTSR